MKASLSSKINQEKITKLYFDIIPEYKKFSQELKSLITSLLKKEDVEFVEIVKRVKNIKSFYEKIERKKYVNPFKEMKDICAIRIICNFPEDVKKTEEVLRKNFKISSYTNEEKNISPYKFWYRSHNFKVVISNQQVLKKEYRLLKNFVAEIQVRTVFMDAWAKIEHKINYKHEWNTSNDTKRKLSRLSAVLELADEQLEELAKK